MSGHGIPVAIVSPIASALAGAIIYHLVAVELRKQRLKRGLLIELSRNFATLQGAEGLVRDPNWGGKLHNRYQTRVFDSLTTTAPTVWTRLDNTQELVEIYDRLAYLNDLKSASLTGGQPLQQGAVLTILTETQDDIEEAFDALKRRWPVVGRNVELE